MKTKLFLLLVIFLVTGITSVAFQEKQDHKMLFEKAKYTMETKGDLNGAINLFNDIIKKYPKEREYAAKSQLYIGLCYEKLGAKEAQKAYQKVVNTYPDQTEMVALAKEKLTLYNSVTAGTTLKAEQSFKQAADLFKQLKYEAAVAEYEKVIKLVPKSQMAQEAQLWIGHCYFKQGKNEQALKSFNSIVKEFPGSNLVPVAELMIGQIQQSTPTKVKKSTAVVLNDNSILDTVTGIKYNKVHTWGGENDIIKTAESITGISPTGKFLLADHTVVQFDNTNFLKLFEPLQLPIKSRLSPDGSKVAFITERGISQIPLSPETGRPTGPVQKLYTFDQPIHNCYHFNWSPDGKILVFSLAGGDNKNNEELWTLSIIEGLLQKILKPSQNYIYQPIFSNNGLNLLYSQNGNVILKSIIKAKSVVIVDSIYQWGQTALSKDNQWLMYNKSADKKCLYRFEDMQKCELSTPEEVGGFVSWANDANKILLYRSSFETQNLLNVISVYGGPSLEYGNQNGSSPERWTPDNKSIVSFKRGNLNDQYGNNRLNMYNLYDQTSKTIEGLSDYNNFSISPDFTKILVHSFLKGKSSPICIFPISWEMGKVTGPPVTIIDDYSGYLQNYMWSPDGKKFAVTLKGEIWICDIEGGAKLQLTKGNRWDRFYIWSPDGKALAVSIQSTNQMQIISTSNGEVINTYNNTEYFDWTGDGKEITIAYTDGQINSISLESGASRKIANWKEISHSLYLNDLSWSPDGKWLGVNGDRLHLINAASGKVTELDADNKMDKYWFIWSPDSKLVSYGSYGSKKIRPESTLWEADLTDFMKKIKPGTEKGFTTDFDFKALELPVGGVAPDGTFTDSRDGHVYKYKKIGTQTWMTENLAYLPEVSPDSATSLIDKRFYVYGYTGSDVKAAKNSENYQKYGVLYNWPAAVNGATASNSAPIGVQGICPKGWHLPSDAEWMILEKNLGMSEEDLKKEGMLTRLSGMVGAKLKSSTGWQDDIFDGQSGFNAIPSGVNSQGKSLALNYTVYFWTSTSLSETKATYRNDYGPGVYRRQDASRGMGLSIRCIKD